MQHVGKADTVNRLEFGGDRRTDWPRTTKGDSARALRRSRQAMAVGIEQSQLGDWKGSLCKGRAAAL